MANYLENKLTLPLKGVCAHLLPAAVAAAGLRGGNREGAPHLRTADVFLKLRCRRGPLKSHALRSGSSGAERTHGGTWRSGTDGLTGGFHHLLAEASGFEFRKQGAFPCGSSNCRGNDEESNKMADFWMANDQQRECLMESRS